MRILLPIICLFLTSCSHRIIQTTKTVEVDSIKVDTLKTQKIVKTKGDSTGVSFNLGQLFTGKILYPESTPEKSIKEPELSFPSEDPIIFKKTQKTGRLTETITISKKGIVTASCKEDSLQRIIDEMMITIQKSKTITTTETKTEVCPPKSKWESFCEWFTWLCIAAIVGATAYRFRKVLPPPINMIP